MGMRLAPGRGSKLRRWQKRPTGKCVVVQSDRLKSLSWRLTLRQRALLKLSKIIGARLTATRKQLNKKGA
jgi:hypothetical protein